jgi:hypothetical protein
MKGIKTTILFVIITTLIIYYHLIPEKCYGLVPVGFLWICLLYVIGIILIIIIVNKSIKQYLKTKSKIAKIPIYAVLCLIAMIMSVLTRNYIRDNSNVLIDAEQWKGLERHTILLKQNRTFEYSWCHVDIGCRTIGKYKMFGDTICLSDSIIGDSMMITKFYRKDAFLIPIKNDLTSNDSSKYFKIKK